jgi:hypothetical protein
MPDPPPTPPGGSRTSEALGRIEALIARGRAIGRAPSADAVRAWQRDCAALVSQLSGGSKAHWLARAYGDAFLVRAGDGRVVIEADQAEIVERVVRVLAQGAASLARLDKAEPGPSAPPRPRRFGFARPELRPILEDALAESGQAFDRGDFARALILTSSVLEAVLTDALDRAGVRTDVVSLEARILAAEGARLIGGGCARLPPAARRYLDLTDAAGELRPGVDVSEREARLAAQVLRVIMRDLDPGR